MGWPKGKPIPEKTKRKISKKLKGHPPTFCRPHSEAHKKRMSKMMKDRKGKKNPFYGKHQSEKVREKIRQARIRYMMSGKVKSKTTQIEVKLEKELKRQGIPYMKQVPLENIAIVDFLLPNKIIIQADGSYWHSRKKNKGKDIAQDTILGFRGYRIYRFTEIQINKSPKRCINKIVGLL